MSNKIMGHLVVGYPSEKESVELMLGMAKYDIYAIEVQIPFSDPIADGETIMKANDVAIENGMSIDKSFELIKRARSEGLSTDVYIMSYVQKIIHYGFEEFCERAKMVSAKGLIVPDLPFDTEEYAELQKSTKPRGINIVPVLSPEILPNRLKSIVAQKPKLVYLTSMKGITGKQFDLSQELKVMAGQIKKLTPESSLAIGFGVSKKSDVQKVLKIADIAVVGSELIRQINHGGYKKALELIKNLR